MILCLLCSAVASFFIFSRTTAQDETQTYTLMLTADAPAEMIYTARAGEAVMIGVTSGGEIDTTLSVFAPDGERIGFNDDLQIADDDSDGVYQWGDWVFSAAESFLLYLAFPQDGDYTFVIDSFNGVQEGKITVKVARWPSALVHSTEEMDNSLIMRVSWLPHQPGYRHTFEAAAGDIITITARDVDHALDPRLILLDANGVELASNDDHLDVDLTLDVLDARITDFVVPVDGSYTLIVSDFLGRAGTVEVTLARRIASQQP